MSNIDIVKVLLKYIGSDTEQDKAIAAGCITILDHEVNHDFPLQEKSEAPANPNPTAGAGLSPKKKEVQRRKPFDMGKLGALLDGGWSVAKIADEIGVSEQTIRNYMKKGGYKA